MNLSKIFFIILLNYFMFVFTLANGFLVGNWKINLNNCYEKNILQESTVIKINNTSVIVIDNSNGGELIGDYNIINNQMIIDNVRITKIPSFTKLPKAIGNYKWIKLIQKEGILINIKSFNDTYLFLKYECVPYFGDLMLKKIE